MDWVEIGNARLICANCLDILPLLSAGSIDAVITDPPYSEWVHTKHWVGSSATKDGFACSFARAKEIGFSSLDESMRSTIAYECARLARRWVLIFSDIESCHLWRDVLENNGLDYIRTGIWVKENATPQFSGDRPACGAEVITICHPKGRKQWNGGGTHAVWSIPIALNRGGNDRRVHTAQKPIRLMTRLVNDFSNKGDLVLDPFAGSGTTGVVCVQLGRKFIGIEVNESWFDVAVKRIREAQMQLHLDLEI